MYRKGRNRFHLARHSEAGIMEQGGLEEQCQREMADQHNSKRAATWRGRWTLQTVGRESRRRKRIRRRRDPSRLEVMGGFGSTPFFLLCNRIPSIRWWLVCGIQTSSVPLALGAARPLVVSWRTFEGKHNRITGCPLWRTEHLHHQPAERVPAPEVSLGQP